MEENFVKKIFLVGNGFDLALGLLTKYNDVMELFKNWELFYDSYKKRSLENEFIKKIVGNTTNSLDSFDSENLQELNQIIKSNSWIEYYLNCEAEIDLWIDFEREIIPVLELFDFILSEDINLNDQSIKFDGYKFLKFETVFRSILNYMET